jgi:thiamine-phosphate pyrophosphorylase
LEAPPPDPREVPFSLYLITDEKTALEPDRVASALGALPHGFAAVQLRAKALERRTLVEAAKALRAITREHGSLLLVNDDATLARTAEADGVHLPARGFYTPDAVRRLFPSLLVGCSTHSVKEAKRAVERGADFVTFGPVWETPSKVGMGEPLGVDALAKAVRSLTVPVVALGGIHTPARATECAFVGAHVACMSAVLGSTDPAAAASAFHDAIEIASFRGPMKHAEH